LRPLAAAATLNRLLGQDMVLNAAFLVERDRERDFDEAVNEVAERERGTLVLRYIGPMAPYSFAAVELCWTPREALEAARITLELPLLASMVDIKKAYRRLAREQHPDRAGATPEAYQRYQEIVAAYDLLITYAENYQHSFSEEDGCWAMDPGAHCRETLDVA
jgi:DnaJ-domain-containing protein 1